MGEYKTPGVYIKEKNAFGNSVVEAETAIPAFIGITEKAVNGTDSLLGKPWKITSMTEFYNYFGGAPELKLTVDATKFYTLSQMQVAAEKKLPSDKHGLPQGLYVYADRSCKETEKVTLLDKDGKAGQEEEDVRVGYALCVDGKHPYSLYYHMKMFFANGGGACYIVSVGTYDYDDYTAIDDDMVGNALEALKLEREVTMIVVPEAATSDRCANIQQLMMAHCGTMANRLAILDVPQGKAEDPLDTRMDKFRDTATGYLSYGAAYYPWLNTSVLSDKDLTGGMLSYTKNFVVFCNKFIKTDDKLHSIVFALMSAPQVVVKNEKLDLSAFNPDATDLANVAYDKMEEELVRYDVPYRINNKDKNNESITVSMPGDVEALSEDVRNTIHAALFNGSPLYNRVMKGVVKALNCLPPSAAMAGIYTMVDNTRGVWKAPANVSLNYVEGVTETIGDYEQQNLNVPVTGKAINVIRPFRGEGIKVWGARTLDGNSQDWRYVNVRRTMLFLEESVRNAARAYVFEPNDSNTWINMKCMIENFLRSVWKRGGLAGATPEDAYEVHVGLGDTMTGDDILEGIMRVTVLVAVTRPAEFIEITFQQQMQKS